MNGEGRIREVTEWYRESYFIVLGKVPDVLGTVGDVE